MNKPVPLIALLAAASLLPSCAQLDLGPQPNNAIVPLPQAAAFASAATSPASPDGQAVVPPNTVGTDTFTPPPNAPTSTAPAATLPANAAMVPQDTTQPAAGAGLHPELPPLVFSVEDAVITALRNNPALSVQRYNVPIQRTFEEQQRAAFDPVFSGQIQGGTTNSPSGLDAANHPTRSNGNSASGTAGVSEFLPTGTSVNANVTTDYTATTNLYSDFVTTRLGLTVTQSLLRGFGTDVNLAGLREAGLETTISQFQLRGFAESLVAQVEEAYWDYALAQRQIDIFSAALKVAQDQLDRTNTFIREGALADTERAAAEAEVALRRENLINARSDLETSRLRLLQLISPGKHDFFARTLALKDKPFVPPGLGDGVEAHVAVAQRMRPEINESKLQIERNQLEVVRTRNGLLPQLDLFITLGKTGYARSFGSSISNLTAAGDYDALAGVKFEQTAGNRDARAQYHRATLTREQQTESLENLYQSVQVDVRTAYVVASRDREQIAATTATRVAQEAALRSEQRKFAVGKSTSLLVAQAQRDLLSAQINEVQSVTNYLKSLVSLYQLEGSLLERRYIDAPGRTPVTLR